MQIVRLVKRISRARVRQRSFLVVGQFEMKVTNALHTFRAPNRASETRSESAFLTGMRTLKLT